jgi:hypothetical protein
MAVNLIDSNDIQVVQDGSDISLELANIDSSVSTSSTNPIQNQAITNYVDGEVNRLDQVDIDLQNQIDNLKEYSTSEIQTGIWTNGKPIYRKVITGNLASGDLQVDLSSLNISILINSYGRCGTTGNYRPLNFYLDGYYISTRYSVGTMYIAASSAYAGEPFELIIEYTKSTD